MTARVLWGMLLAALLAFALWAAGAGGPAPQGPVGGAAPRQQLPASPPAPFVPSMAGTQPDGRVQATGDNLRIDAELRHLFDYYLSALGETELPAIRAGIEQELSRRLQPAAAAQARRLLGQYLAYKRALSEVADGRRGPGEAAPRAALAAAARGRLLAMQSVRQRYFTPAESAGLFGDSDARDQDAVARLEAMDDKTLTPAQRQERLAEADRRLPPELREEREAPLRVLKLEQQVASARAAGASEDDIYRLRASAIDPQAAGRLAQLDQEQAEWQRRIAAYRAASVNLAGNQAAIQQLRDRLFTPGEQKRLGAYE
ncbi:lipase chaperone [Pseudoduganella eburnea]|uniref:Lipase helper protein n=1 Tax=Massilia eburnea TaxID=1776165 RepID=A0A6L6QQ81_9BURK|nr:lipase chaperone [Massilia eburnea]